MNKLKHKMMLGYTVLALACLAMPVYALAPVTPEVKKLYARASKILAQDLPYSHLYHRSFDDSISTNGLFNFLDNLDFDHSFFLAADIESFRQQEKELDDQLEQGNIDLAFDIYNVFIERVSNRVAYVEKLLNEGFDTTAKEHYDFDRDEAPWPSGTEAWNELWRKKIKNRYVAKLVNEKIAEEEAKNKPELEPETSEAGNINSNQTDIATNSVATEKEETQPPSIKKLTPEEDILKEYRSFYSLMQDNDADWLVPLYITSFVRAYDPHTEYMSANNKEDFDIGMKLSLVGIGALLSTEDGAAKVVRLIPGGPAEKDGRLQPNDKIIAVAQGDEEPVDVRHWPLSKTVRLIRGELDTKVVLTVIPASDSLGTTTKQIDLIRAKVNLEERAAKGRTEKILSPGEKEYSLGYISIPEFYSDMYSPANKKSRSLTRDVKKIIKDLTETNSIQGLILDLRNNGGGSLPESIDLTGIFIDSGPVVQVRGSGQREPMIYPDVDPGTDYDGPLLILVNRQSASASEILTGALQDTGRALVVGDSKTHGKGTVQSLAPLRQYNPKLGSLKVTTALFYRISGGSTQKRGIEPDIVIPSFFDSMEIGEEFLPNALAWSQVEPAIYRSSNKLKKMVPELRKRSEKRRSEDPKFKSYMESLNYLAEQRETKRISLAFDERLERARRQKEIIDAMEESAEKQTASLDVPDETTPPLSVEGVDGKEEPEEEDHKNDLILTEAYNILIDMIELEKTPPAFLEGLSEVSLQEIKLLLEQ